MLALVFLLVRPQGLFGEKIIERVWEAMLYREAGQFKTSYAADQAIFPLAQDRWFVLALLLAAYLVPPLFLGDYWFNAILIPFLIFALAALG